jgi:hypothetical protein
MGKVRRGVSKVSIKFWFRVVKMIIHQLCLIVRDCCVAEIFSFVEECELEAVEINCEAIWVVDGGMKGDVCGRVS